MEKSYYPDLPSDDDENLTEEEEATQPAIPMPPSQMEQGRYLINGKCACGFPYCEIERDKRRLQRCIYDYDSLIAKYPYVDYEYIDTRDPDHEVQLISADFQEQLECKLENQIKGLREMIDYHDQRMMDRYYKHQDAILAKEARGQGGKHLGAREFTLTYSPEWFGDNEARRQMIRAIDKLAKYYDKELLYFKAVGEVGENGLSHIHALYQLSGGRKMTDKNFKRAYPRWNPKKKLGKGFEGGHHATVGRLSNFMGYMEKEENNSWYVYTHNAVQAPSSIQEENRKEGSI